MYVIKKQEYFITFFEISGHFIITGNEAVDLTLKEAISLISAKSVSINSNNNLKSLIHQICDNELNFFWRSNITKLNEIKRDIFK